MSINDLYYSQNVGGMAIVDLPVPADQTVAGPNFQIKIGEVTSRISGTYFFQGRWPAPPAEVRLITTTTFPPSLDQLSLAIRYHRMWRTIIIP